MNGVRPILELPTFDPSMLAGFVVIVLAVVFALLMVRSSLR